MKRLLSQLVPFIFIGIAIVAFAFGIMLLAYLFVFGAIIGLILFIVAWLKQTFFPHKKNPPQKKRGRVIDSTDWEKK
ncbi:MAG: hypothetical protein A3F12_02890 [Gammaproteobacteria bacterium RIFCSPHIGHO2_12_FULL_38_14]|nr:MAG: hypothetical protein A3F12_02890 [Gammaproteobacteria bacterium RIFCSPHIGHO2_12_FULL_38_14]